MLSILAWIPVCSTSCDRKMPAQQEREWAVSQWKHQVKGWQNAFYRRKVKFLLEIEWGWEIQTRERAGRRRRQEWIIVRVKHRSPLWTEPCDLQKGQWAWSQVPNSSIDSSAVRAWASDLTTPSSSCHSQDGGGLMQSRMIPMEVRSKGC